MGTRESGTAYHLYMYAAQTWDAIGGRCVCCGTLGNVPDQIMEVSRMGLRDRLTAGKTDAFNVLHLLNDLWLLRDETITMDTLSQRHALTDDERSELTEILNKVAIQRNDRTQDFYRAWQTLVALQRGVIDWDAATAAMGLDCNTNSGACRANITAVV